MDSRPLTDARLVAYVKEALRYDGEIDGETPLFSSGALDSAAMMSLIAFVEETASIQVRAEDVTLEHFDTASRIARFAANQP